MSQQRMVLLNPGPVTLTKRVRAALTEGDWCHREPEFAAHGQNFAERNRLLDEKLDTMLAAWRGTATSADGHSIALLDPATGERLPAFGPDGKFDSLRWGSPPMRYGHR